MEYRISEETIESDLRELEILFKKTFEPSDYMLSESLDEGKIRSILSKQEAKLYTCRVPDGTPVGYLYSVRRSVPEFSHRVKIQALAVLPSERGKGVGSALLNYVINLAKTEKLKLVFLEVVSANTAAINLYEKFGLLETGSLPNGYKKNSVFYDIKTYALTL